MLLPGPAVEEGGGLHGAGGWSLLSSDGVDGSSAFDSFPLSSPTNDGDDAGIGDGGDEAKAVELDGGDSKGTILTGGSVERGSSLHAPRVERIRGVVSWQSDCGLCMFACGTVGEATVVTGIGISECEER
jgi:hypothetical protein